MSRLPLGTLFNVATVLIGSMIGLALQHVFSPGMQDIAFQAVGLGTIFIAMKMMWRLPEGKMLVFLFGLILGGLFGEMMGLASFFEQSTAWLKGLTGNTDGTFSEGMITAFLLYCVGSMTIVGSLEEGVSGNRDLLIVKSVLDGFSSIALASTYGVGVAFSVIPLFIFQGSLTLLAKKGKKFFDPVTVDIMSGIGGALIFGIAINLLKLGSVKVENLLPALVAGVVLYKVSPGTLSFLNKYSRKHPIK